MNETLFTTMPSRNLNDCTDCENHTNLNNPTAIGDDAEIFENPVIIAVMASVGFLALLTIIVSVWSIRRCYMNNKTRKSWDIPAVVKDEDKNKSTKPETAENFFVTRKADMYGGSLKDLRHDSNAKDMKVVVQRDLHSAYSHTFLHRGDHNNTIINSLSATWSIQTLPQPRHPWEVIRSKTAENPLYARPVIPSKRCASSNALYESADDIHSRMMDFKPFHYYRKDPEPQTQSPVYERIIDYQKNPGANSMGTNTK